MTATRAGRVWGRASAMPARSPEFPAVLAGIVQPPEWHEWASCTDVDPELWHPEKGASSAEAKRICAGCAVREECLEDALALDERHGIRGGLTARERRRLAAEQKAAA